MSALSALNEREGTHWPARTLAGSGLLIGVSGALWWAWDASPGRGRALVLLGLVVVVVSVVAMPRRIAPAWVLAGLGALLVVFACYEVIQAIATILSQSAAHTA